MMPARGRCALAAVGLVVAVGMARPSDAALREVGSWLARPAVLPFAWRAVDTAQRGGDANEVFARARQLLRWLPTWSDGHMVFAYRYAIDGDETPTAPESRGARAAQRLELALAYLDGARRDAPRHELSLLQTMSMLPLVAEAHEPQLREHLRARGGAAGLADHYLAEAEALSGSPAVREQRLFLTPQVAAALLEGGATEAARSLLVAAIGECDRVRERELASEWRARLEEALRRLDGDRTVDLTALLADERFAPLIPFFR
ncbi:MAG: hypothetical protein RL398_3424 [Planctomycetota bacterium]